MNDLARIIKNMFLWKGTMIILPRNISTKVFHLLKPPI